MFINQFVVITVIRLQHFAPVSLASLGYHKINEKRHITYPFLRKRGTFTRKTFFIVTTPTQPQLNSKVGFATKMTLDRHYHHHHKINVINISGVPNLI